MKLGKHQLNALLFFYRNSPSTFLLKCLITKRAILSLIQKGFLQYATHRYTDMAEITGKGKEVAKAYIEDRLFIGIFPCGFSYADRHQEKAGDYKRLAFLPYSTLKLEVYQDCPDCLLPFITEHATDIQSKKGQEQDLSTSGQTITLGYALPR